MAAEPPRDVYAPPQARVAEAMAQAPRRGWIAYLGLLVVLGLAAAVPYWTMLLATPDPPVGVGIVGTALNVLGLLGLGGYAFRRRVLARWVWAVAFVLVGVQQGLPAIGFVRLLIAGGSSESAALMGLASVALALPMLVALWRYAFASPELWTPARASTD